VGTNWKRVVNDLGISLSIQPQHPLTHSKLKDNVKKGMEILVQAKVPIERPMDFLAEMLKSDEHMLKVK